MVNKIIDGISIKLNSVFGDGYEISTKKIEQGLEEPCFFIKVLNPSQESLLGPRKSRTNSFDIHYFGNDPDDVAEQLFSELEFITLTNGDILRGSNMKYEVVDGVLHFFVNFNLFTVKVGTPEDSMEELIMKG